MKLTGKQIMAVKHCLKCKIPFALWSDRGEKLAQFRCSLPHDGVNEWPEDIANWNGFFINYFGNDEDYIVGVCGEYDENSVPENVCFDDEPEIEPVDQSTDYYTYISIVNKLIQTLDKPNSKVVFSRVIAQEGSDDVLDVAWRYFSEYPHTFRYLCYTHETGIWFGATPELVASYDINSRELETEAIAGTRPADITGEWDVKNLKEHSIVPLSIMAQIKKMGGECDDCNFEVSEVKFGDIAHLRTEIHAIMPKGVNVQEMLTTLSPTAAIAGWPREEAIKKIFAYENHPRHFYGGFVGYKKHGMVKAYANIRCAFVGEEKAGKRLYNIYAGGGLISKSKAEEEWNETESKSRHLVNIVKNSNEKIQ